MDRSRSLFLAVCGALVASLIAVPAVAGSARGETPAKVAPRGVVSLREIRPSGRPSGADVAVPFLRPSRAGGPDAVGSAPRPTGTAPEPRAPALGAGWTGLEITQCCESGFATPPDPDIAVGPSHIVTAVNKAFAVYDKAGALLSGPTTFFDFWTPVGGCGDEGYFDPFIGYDPFTDRFVLGIDVGGFDLAENAFCIAVSNTGSPLGTWTMYEFDGNEGLTTAWMDYPQMGIGHDAIYVSGNFFDTAGNYVTTRIYAFDKADMYAGLDADSGFKVSPFCTPEPAKPTPDGMPTSGPQYFVSEGLCGASSDHIGLQSWDSPFGANVLTTVATPTVTTYVAPPPVTQPGPGAGTVDSGDVRMMDTQWAPDGTMYAVHTIGCSPGGGTVACIQWFQLGTTGTVVQQGIIGTAGTHRFHPDLALDADGNLTIGYTRSSPSEFPSAVLTGRLAVDPAGTMGTEAVAKAGEITYEDFNASATPPTYRWGDYAGLMADPADPCSTFYFGEYSKATGSPSGRWGTWIQPSSFGGCGTSPGTLRFSLSTFETVEGGPPATITVSRVGGSVGTVTVDFATSNGTAGGADYTPAAGTLTFDPGEVVQTFAVATLDDALVEPDETVELELSSPTGGANLGTPSTAVLSIQDDEVAQPDAKIRLGKLGAFKGNDVYNTTGKNQTISVTGGQGGPGTFFIRVQNDGTVTDSFKIKGCGSSSAATVKYLAGTSGSTNITSAVTAGTHTLSNVAVGASKTIRAVMTVKSTASDGAKKSCLIAATSTALATAKDAVKWKLTVTQI